MIKPIFLFALFLLCGCQSQLINQKKDNQMHGLWIEEYSSDTIRYKSVGKYRLGEPIKRWKYFANGKIIKKERYKKEYCIVRHYHPNGVLQSEGITKIRIENNYAHWFYSGQWNFFDTNKKLVTTRLYDNGELISEKIIETSKK